jgi:hypothetical protein
MSASTKLTPAEKGWFDAVSGGDSSSVSRILAANPGLARMVNCESGPDYLPGSAGCARGGTPLHFAGSTGVIDLLLDHGAGIDARDIDHFSTPLQYLCAPRRTLARHLLDRGAEPDVFSLVAAGTPAELQTWIRRHPGSLHAKVDNAAFPPGPGPGGAANILNFTIGRDCTLLHAAATVNRPDMVECLLSLGIDVNQRGAYDECTALHTAAWHNRVEAGAALLDHGARLDMVSGPRYENTPLGWAIVAGQREMVDFLIERGAEPRPWYVHDAEAALAGAFREVAVDATPAERQRILDRIHAFVSARRAVLSAARPSGSRDAGNASADSR